MATTSVSTVRGRAMTKLVRTESTEAGEFASTSGMVEMLIQALQPPGTTSMENLIAPVNPEEDLAAPVNPSKVLNALPAQAV